MQEVTNIYKEITDNIPENIKEFKEIRQAHRDTFPNHDNMGCKKCYNINDKNGEIYRPDFQHAYYNGSSIYYCPFCGTRLVTTLSGLFGLIPQGSLATDNIVDYLVNHRNLSWDQAEHEAEYIDALYCMHYRLNLFGSEQYFIQCVAAWQNEYEMPEEYLVPLKSYYNTDKG